VLVHHVARVVGLQHGQAAGPFVDEFGFAFGHFFRGLNAGLFVFFALSGYLLARPFAQALVGARRMPSIARYARARMLRIVPAFWVVFTATVLVHGTYAASPLDLASVYGFAQVYHPTAVAGRIVQAWTLDIEMAFYLVLPLAALALGLLLRRTTDVRRRAILLLTGIGLAAAASLAVRVAWANPAGRSTLPEYLVAFTPGIALAVVEAAWGQGMLASARARRASLVLAAAALASFAFHCLAEISSPGLGVLSGTMTGGALVGAALLREWSGGRGWRLFAHPVSAWIGERSYGIYLVHLLVISQVLWAVDGVGSPRRAFAQLLLVALPLSILAAAVLWRLVEHPAQQLGRRRRRAPERRDEPLPVQATA
jgi:peptidoglycan/LPS O-acetylase OafA/YrhL